MAALKRYATFESLKLARKSGNINPHKKNNAFSEFEAFLEKLRNEYSNQKKTKKQNGKQPNR